MNVRQALRYRSKGLIEWGAWWGDRGIGGEGFSCGSAIVGKLYISCYNVVDYPSFPHQSLISSKITKRSPLFWCKSSMCLLCLLNAYHSSAVLFMVANDFLHVCSPEVLGQKLFFMTLNKKCSCCKKDTVTKHRHFWGLSLTLLVAMLVACITMHGQIAL